MTVRRDLRELVATALDDAGVGTYALSLAGTEPWPIVWRKLPASPDQALVLACYGLGGDHEQGVQVTVRGSREDATTAEDQADAVRVALHGLEGLSHGATTLVLLTFTSAAELGTDANGRERIAVNFRAVTDDPNTALDY